MDTDYYERKFQRSGDPLRICFYCFVALLFVLLLMCVTGCKTYKVAESTDTKDSVTTEIVEKIIKDTVKVVIEIPAETKERETRDSTSFLETSFAKSTAKLTWQGDVPFLFHSLENKPQQIEKPVEVETKEKIKTVYKTRYVSKTKTVEKRLTAWQQTKQNYGGWAMGILAALVVILILTTGFWKRVVNVIRYF